MLKRCVTPEVKLQTDRRKVRDNEFRISDYGICCL
jgi:hypothetical protein